MSVKNSRRARFRSQSELPKPLFCWYFPCSFRRHAIGNGLVASLGSQLVFVVGVKEFHFDFSITAIVPFIRWLVSDQVLGTQFIRDFRKRSLQRQHVAGKESHPASFVTQPFHVFITVVFYGASFDAGNRSRQPCFG